MMAEEDRPSSSLLPPISAPVTVDAAITGLSLLSFTPSTGASTGAPPRSHILFASPALNLSVAVRFLSANSAQLSYESVARPSESLARETRCKGDQRMKRLMETAAKRR